MYGEDLGNALLRERRSWRWFSVRLAGLMVRDTPTATLITTPPPPRRVSPEQLGNVLAGWAQ